MNSLLAVRSILAFVLCVPGLIANLFTMSSVLHKMRLEGSLQTANILMASNSLNNVLLVFLIFSVMLALNLKVCPSQRGLFEVLFIWEMSSVMQMWFITLICVFYCLKIVPGKGIFSLWLKNNFSSGVAILLTAGFAFSLVLSSFDVTRVPHINGTNKRFNSTCHPIKLPDSLFTPKLIITSLLHISVFSLMTCSCAAILKHLCSHVRRMRGNQPDVGGAKQQGIVWVALMILLLAVEFGGCSSIRHLLIWQSNDELSDFLIADLSIVSLTLCILIPTTLIAGTSSLRETTASCCFKA